MDILIGPGVVDAYLIHRVMEGKHYNRSIHAHRLMFEALHPLLLVFFIEILATDMQEQFSNFIKHISQAYPSTLYLNLFWWAELSDGIVLYKEFQHHEYDKNPMFTLW